MLPRTVTFNRFMETGRMRGDARQCTGCRFYVWC